jgi:hypothetical protein
LTKSLVKDVNVLIEKEKQKQSLNVLIAGR